jgi:uncharacterized protein YbjQ (UPF0145 family)
VPENHVVTSELSGEELWNLAAMGYVPHQLVMATSVYSLGVAAGIGALFRSIQRGELPEVTQLIYQARENCLELVRNEAQRLGADQVMGNRLQIREMGSGLVEVIAIGTAVRRVDTMKPATPQLIAQAVIIDKGSRDREDAVSGLAVGGAGPMAMARNRVASAGPARFLPILFILFVFISMCCTGLIPVLLNQ